MAAAVADTDSHAFQTSCLLRCATDTANPSIRRSYKMQCKADASSSTAIVALRDDTFRSPRYSMRWRDRPASLGQTRCVAIAWCCNRLSALSSCAAKKRLQVSSAWLSFGRCNGRLCVAGPERGAVNVEAKVSTDGGGNDRVRLTGCVCIRRRYANPASRQGRPRCRGVWPLWLPSCVMEPPSGSRIDLWSCVRSAQFRSDRAVLLLWPDASLSDLLV